MSHEFLNTQVNILNDLALIIFVLAALFFLKLLWDWSLKRPLESHTGENTGKSGGIKNADNPWMKYSTSRQNEKLSGSTYFDKISDPRFHEFSEMLPEIVFQCESDGKLVFVNKAGYEILGINEQDLKSGINVFEFLHPDDRKRLQDDIQSYVFSQHKPENHEYRIVTRKNELKQVLAYTLPVYNENHQLRGLRGMVVDISQRKKTEDALLVLQDIVSHMDMGLNVYQTDDLDNPTAFRLEMVNDAATRLIRFLNVTNIGKTIDELSPILMQNRLHSIFYNVVVTQSPSEVEEFIYQPDPNKVPGIYNLKIFPLPSNRVAMIIEDVSVKKKTEAALKITNFGLENAGDLILWIDENANVTYVNETAATKYGYSKEELIGMELSEVDNRITNTQWYELLQILENKNSITMESIHKTAEGTTFPVEMSVNKVNYDGKRQYFAFVRDISERNRNAELEQNIQVARKSAALKQQFLANMSHEIRTPMTGIMGMTSLLMRSNLNMAQLEYVRNIKISSENLLNIINDVLDLSKIEAGKMDLKPNRILLTGFVNQLKEMFQHIAQSKGVNFKTHIDPLIPKTILVDDNRLKQLANNLISNAFKFTDEGEVSISFYLKEKRNDYLILSCDVIDTGTGISEKNQKQIFEKFTQIDTSLIRPFEGTGLGLAICRELANLMGGEIFVESELGKGSKFTFTFRAGFDETEMTIPIDISSGDLKDLNLSVLHVEDKLLNQKVVGYILLNAGCNVDFRSNGMEAVELYQPGKYDIILMDIQMPVMDGISAYKKLKELHGDKLCPVIGLSANAMEGDAEKFMELGLDDYIAKPFKPQQLYEKLVQWAGRISGSKND
jgi:PAS domain S-box-containing protein